MSSFTVDKLPEEALPKIEDLNGDMRIVAEMVGVRMALMISEQFGGTPCSLYGHKKWIIRHRDNVIRAEYDAGGTTVIALARKYDLCDRQIYNIIGQEPYADKQMSLF